MDDHRLDRRLNAASRAGPRARKARARKAQARQAPPRAPVRGSIRDSSGKR